MAEVTCLLHSSRASARLAEKMKKKHQRFYVLSEVAEAADK
jgi:hypothetical protein